MFIRVDNFGVAVVVRSEDTKFAAGDYVAGYLSASGITCTDTGDRSDHRFDGVDFETYSVWPVPQEQNNIFKEFFPIQTIDVKPGISLTAWCGALGMPGETAVGMHLLIHAHCGSVAGGTAYGGWKTIGEPKAKEVRVSNIDSRGDSASVYIFRARRCSSAMLLVLLARESLHQ